MAQIDGLKEYLISTNNKYLLHQDNHATSRTYWGGKIDSRTGLIVGKNRLGEIWMKLRSQELPSLGGGGNGGVDRGNSGVGRGRDINLNKNIININPDDEKVMSLEDQIELKKSQCLRNKKFLVLSYKTDSFYFSLMNALNEYNLLKYYKLSENISLLDISYNKEQLITSLNVEAVFELKKGIGLMLKNNKSNINCNDWPQSVDNYIKSLYNCEEITIDDIHIMLACILLNINISVFNYKNSSGVKEFNVNEISEKLKLKSVFDNTHTLKTITLLVIDNDKYFYVSDTNDVDRNYVFYEQFTLFSLDIKYDNIIYSIVYFQEMNDNIKIIGFIDKITLQLKKFKSDQKNLVNNICKIFQNIKNEKNILDESLDIITKYNFWKDIYSDNFFIFNKLFNINQKYCKKNYNNYKNIYVGRLKKYGKLKSYINNGTCNIKIEQNNK